MTLKSTFGSLAQGAVSSAATAVRHPISTATTAVRHPISTASMAVGLVKGTAEASVDLVRGVVRGPGQADDTMQDRVQEKVEDHLEGKVDVPTQRDNADAGQDAAGQQAPSEVIDVPREPEVVPKPVPEIDELPEPIVIEADDSPGEAFHTEPKAATRDSEHGGSPGDREEVEGYVEEIPSDLSNEIAEDPVVWTSESSTAPESADLNRSI
jgi:hypothetical protein